jgi:hypothetical protein
MVILFSCDWRPDDNFVWCGLIGTRAKIPRR